VVVGGHGRLHLTVGQGPHLGGWDDEAPVLAWTHNEVIPDNGLVIGGRRHEIHLSDPLGTAPERRRTILRQPLVRTAAHAPNLRLIASIGGDPRLPVFRR